MKEKFCSTQVHCDVPAHILLQVKGRPLRGAGRSKAQTCSHLGKSPSGLVDFKKQCTQLEVSLYGFLDFTSPRSFFTSAPPLGQIQLHPDSHGRKRWGLGGGRARSWAAGLSCKSMNRFLPPPACFWDECLQLVQSVGASQQVLIDFSFVP